MIKIKGLKHSLKESTVQELNWLVRSTGNMKTFALESCTVSEANLDLLFWDNFDVEELRLSQVGAKLETKDHCHSLTQLLSQKRCKIETLQLPNNRISLSGALTLGQGLGRNCSIKNLDLSYNLLGPKGCYILCEALSHPHVQVHSLDLSNNNIENLGAKSLSVLLSKKQLLELRVKANLISADGMKLLFEGLTHNTVKIFDAKDNIITVDLL